MDKKSANPTVSIPDLRFIYVDLQNSDDWEKIEMILTQAQFPVRTPDEQTAAPRIEWDRQ